VGVFWGLGAGDGKGESPHKSGKNEKETRSSNTEFQKGGIVQSRLLVFEDRGEEAKRSP